MATTSDQLAERIISLRTKKKLSQAKLAELAHININTISRIESRTGSPSFTTIGLIADALDVSVFDLIAKPKPSAK